MNGAHASQPCHGFVSKEHYVHRKPAREAQLIAKFGSFPTESLRFNKMLGKAPIYRGIGPTGIAGVAAQTCSKAFYILYRNAPISTSLDAPNQILSGVVVVMSDVYHIKLTVSAAPLGTHDSDSHLSSYIQAMAVS